VKIKSPKWTTQRFKLAAQAGCFHDMKVELVKGRLVELTESPEHRNSVENIVELFASVFNKQRWYVVRESSVQFIDWTPLPDIAVCFGSRRPRYSYRTPRSEDVALLVEVSQSTYRYNRQVKLPRYARAGIPLVWIVNLESRTVEDYWEPRGKHYVSCEVFSEGQSIRLLAGEPPEVIDPWVPVSDVLS
jgi:Uma2 family endonuclease